LVVEAVEVMMATQQAAAAAVRLVDPDTLVVPAQLAKVMQEQTQLAGEYRPMGMAAPVVAVLALPLLATRVLTVLPEEWDYNHQFLEQQHTMPEVEVEVLVELQGLLPQPVAQAVAVLVVEIL
jgi:hypothetical protein